MPLSLVLDPGDELGLMQEEIFGPLLPVKPYDSLDEAIGYVNAGERPLGLYVFGHDEAADRPGAAAAPRPAAGRASTPAPCRARCPRSASAASGTSGMGRHHGIDGFREFSNPRGVFVRGEDDLVDAFYPPYGDIARTIVEGGFSQAPGSA